MHQPNLTIYGFQAVCGTEGATETLASRSGSGIGASGKSTVKVVPRPGTLSTLIVPPCASVASLQKANPSPELPPSLRPPPRT